MSNLEVRLAQLILKEIYGDASSKVANVMSKKGSIPLRGICKEAKLKLSQVKKCMCVLVLKKLASYQQHKRGFIEYNLNIQNIIQHARYPKFIYSTKTLYGDAAELIVEELLNHGELLLSDIINKTITRLQEALPGEPTVPPETVKQKFDNLVKTHFIQRCPSVDEPAEGEDHVETAIPEFNSDTRHLYTIPDVDLSSACRKRKRLSEEGDEASDSKRLKTDTQEHPDSGIYWCINFDRFNQHLRDQVIVASVASKIDKKASEIVRTILQLGELSTDSDSFATQPQSSSEIFRTIPKELEIKRHTYDEYMSILLEDSMEYATKVSESGGGMYCINFKKVMTNLCKAHLESVIQERFGSKSCRIFRLLLAKKHMEQKQIEEVAMIPAKEAKEILYNMFTEHFVTITELSKTPDHAPSRTFYLFSVNMGQVTRMLLQHCYKAMANAMIKRQNEMLENRRLLDKQQRVEAIIESTADVSQKEEIEAMITPPERTQLEKVKHLTNKLEQSEIQLDETIFILQMFLKYSHISI